jgi:hypothetical protein
MTGGMHMEIKIIIEGIGMCFLLFGLCFYLLKKYGPAGISFLYRQEIRDKCVELGLTTYEELDERKKKCKLISVLIQFAYLIVCVWGINEARGFWEGFWQLYVIIEIENIFDRLVIDEYWVNHTHGWDIPETEQFKPYINTKEKMSKWIVGIAGYAVVAAIVSAIMALIIK